MLPSVAGTVVAVVSCVGRFRFGVGRCLRHQRLQTLRTYSYRRLLSSACRPVRPSVCLSALSSRCSPRCTCVRACVHACVLPEKPFFWCRSQVAISFFQRDWAARDILGIIFLGTVVSLHCGTLSIAQCF